MVGVDPSTIWKAAERGEIAHMKEGRNRRYKRPDVEDWARRRKSVVDRVDQHERRLKVIEDRLGISPPDAPPNPQPAGDWPAGAGHP
jgi:hypothetical protein